MTLKQYRKHINSKDFDGYEDKPVVYSSDDEGNNYDRVLFAPALMEDVDISNDTGTRYAKCICIN